MLRPDEKPREDVSHRDRRGELVRSLLLLAAAVAVAVVANIALLGYVTNRDDPVGKLNPTATLPTAPATVAVTPRDEEADD